MPPPDYKYRDYFRPSLWPVSWHSWWCEAPDVTCQHTSCVSLMSVRAGRAVTWARARALRSQASQAGAEECWAAGGDPARALETGDKPQPVISQEGTRRAVRAVCWVRTQCYKGDKRHVSPACSDLQWPAEAAAWCGTPGWGWDRDSRHLTCAGLRARARDGWKCFVFSWQQRGAEGRGQRRQPGTQAQVGGEIGQRHGNIYESNYFGTELGETQGFSSYSLGKCGCWPPLAKQFRIFEFIPDFLFTFPLSAFE